MDRYDPLRIENQLCFPLYACAREVIKLYKPFLDPLGLTYTQYVVMLALWERERTTAGELGELLHLDSGTLTPVLKRLGERGLITRRRGDADERVLVVALTDDGRALRDRAAEVPRGVGACIPLAPEDGAALFQLLRRLLDAFAQNTRTGRRPRG